MIYMLYNMTFRSLIIFFSCLSSFVPSLHIIAKIGIAQVLGRHFLMTRRAIMAMHVQFTIVARLGHLVVLHRFVHFAPRLTEAIAQRMGTHHIAGEIYAGQQYPIPVDGKARTSAAAKQSLIRHMWAVTPLHKELIIAGRIA